MPLSPNSSSANPPRLVCWVPSCRAKRGTSAAPSTSSSPDIRTPATDALHRRLQHPVLQVDLEARLAHISGQAQPPLDRKIEIDIQQRQRAQVERRLLQLAVDVGETARLLLAGCLLAAQERPQIEVRAG